MDNEKLIHDINLLKHMLHEELVDEDMLEDTIACLEEKGSTLLLKGFTVEEAFDFLEDLFFTIIEDYEGK